MSEQRHFTASAKFLISLLTCCIIIVAMLSPATPNAVELIMQKDLLKIPAVSTTALRCALSHHSNWVTEMACAVGDIKYLSSIQRWATVCLWAPAIRVLASTATLFSSSCHQLNDIFLVFQGFIFTLLMKKNLPEKALQAFALETILPKMNARDMLAFAALATVVMTLMQIESTAACSCIPSHPQSHFCSSDYGKFQVI